MRGLEALLLALVVTAGLAPGLASAGDSFGGCEDGGRPVETRHDGGLAFIAKAELKDGSPVILTNRESRPYLSAATMRWLYLRECGHIASGHLGQPEITPRMQRDADCWAVRKMIEEERSSRYDVLAIQRDLETMRKAWPREFLGEEVRADLSRCVPGSPRR